MPQPDILATLGLEPIAAGAGFSAAPGQGLRDAEGHPVVLLPETAVGALQQVIEGERTGAWRATMKACGRACARRLAESLDAHLRRAGQPALAALPLEACLALLTRSFAARGWGRLAVDLAHAERGVLVAHVEHPYFASALPALPAAPDAMLAGALCGFFEYITHQSLDAEEIACVGGAAPRASFAIASRENLAGVAGRIGQDNADTIIARLTGTRT